MVERETPLVWKVGDKKRVLEPEMRMRDKTLILLHATPGVVAEGDIRSWVEAKNSTEYRRDVLVRLHKEKLVEYDPVARTVVISPTGWRTWKRNSSGGRPPEQLVLRWIFRFADRMIGSTARVPREWTGLST